MPSLKFLLQAAQNSNCAVILLTRQCPPQILRPQHPSDFYSFPRLSYTLYTPEPCGYVRCMLWGSLIEWRQVSLAIASLACFSPLASLDVHAILQDVDLDWTGCVAAFTLAKCRGLSKCTGGENPYFFISSHSRPRQSPTQKNTCNFSSGITASKFHNNDDNLLKMTCSNSSSMSTMLPTRSAQCCYCCVGVRSCQPGCLGLGSQEHSGSAELLSFSQLLAVLKWLQRCSPWVFQNEEKSRETQKAWEQLRIDVNKMTAWQDGTKSLLASPAAQWWICPWRHLDHVASGFCKNDHVEHVEHVWHWLVGRSQIAAGRKQSAAQLFSIVHSLSYVVQLSLHHTCIFQS